MGIVGAIVTILGGCLAASTFLVARKPDAKATLDKLVPVQGYIGVVLLIWGVWGILYFLLHLNYLSLIPVRMLIFFVGSAVCLGVGFLLGYGLIVQYTLSGSEKNKARAEAVRGKLTAYQVPLGFAAVGLGVLSLFVWVI
jgi:hypothetical protein